MGRVIIVGGDSERRCDGWLVGMSGSMGVIVVTE